MSEIKEPHIFSPDLPGSSRFGVRSMEEYQQLFEGVELPVAGESSVWYLYSKIAPELIDSYAPNSKVIICIRDPLTMIPSLHRQFLYSLNEDQRELDQAIQMQLQREAGEHIPSDSHFPFGLQYELVARYDQPIQRYLERFGADRILFVPAEDLDGSTAETIGAIIEFLGLHPVEIQTERQNRSEDKLSYPGPLRRLAKANPESSKKVVEMLPLSIRRLVRRSLTSNGGSGQVIWSEPTSIDVARRLSESVARTRELTGLPLDGWLGESFTEN